MDSLQVSIQDDMESIVQEIEVAMRTNFIDLELIIANRSHRRKMLPKSRIPLFLLRKMGPSIVSGVLLGFAKICQPIWLICDYLEYFELEAQQDVVQIFLQRVKQYEKNGINLTEIAQLADALNRISHFPEWDMALKNIVSSLPVDLIRRLQKSSPVSQKGILLSLLLAKRSGHTLSLENHTDTYGFLEGYHSLVEEKKQPQPPVRIISCETLMLQQNMNCAILYPQSSERRKSVTYIETEKEWEEKCSLYDILIMRGHGIPSNTLSIIEQAKPKIVFFGGCQGIDAFLKEIGYHVKNGGTIEAFRGVTYIGTVRIGRAHYNDQIAEYIFSHVQRNQSTMDTTYISQITDGLYTSFVLE